MVLMQGTAARIGMGRGDVVLLVGANWVVGTGHSVVAGAAVSLASVITSMNGPWLKPDRLLSRWPFAIWRLDTGKSVWRRDTRWVRGGDRSAAQAC